MANTNKNKKPKFSSYWIYAIILLIFVIFPIFNGGSFQEGKNITQSQYLNYLNNGDIEKIDIKQEQKERIFIIQTEHEIIIRNCSGIYKGI